MTNRLRIFIDGTWLARNRGVFARELGRPVVLDFEALPGVLAAKAACGLKLENYVVAGTHYYGSIPEDYDMLDNALVQKQRAFFFMLREKFRYQLEIYNIDFKGHRVPKEYWGTFTPHEKEVDAALATALVDGAAADSYDTAVCVLGDLDLMPAITRARKHGKRIVLASVGGSCSREYIPGVTVDAPILWIERFIPEIERVKKLVCSALYHPEALPREFPAPLLNARAEDCYCELCAKLAERLRFADSGQFSGANTPELQAAHSVPSASSAVGIVTKVVQAKGFGFITARGERSFFHVSDLIDIAWTSVKCGMKVAFDIGNAPSLDKAGRSVRIRPCGGTMQVFQAV